MHTKIRLFPKKIIYFAFYFVEVRRFFSFLVILNVVKNLCTFTLMHSDPSCYSG